MEYGSEGGAGGGGAGGGGAQLPALHHHAHAHAAHAHSHAHAHTHGHGTVTLTSLTLHAPHHALPLAAVPVTGTGGAPASAPAPAPAPLQLHLHEQAESAASSAAAAAAAAGSAKGKRKRRKRGTLPSKAETKYRANTNQPYINYKGQEVKPKTFDPTFVCPCTKKCTTKVPLETRREIFSQFWSMGSFEGRCALILNYVKQFYKKRSVRRNNPLRRLYTRKYYFNNVEVCQNAFVRTLQISTKRVDKCFKKVCDDDIKDLRGKRKNKAKVTEEKLEEAILDHIHSFPQYRNYMARADHYYLAPHLSLDTMFELFVEQNKARPVSLVEYKHEFETRSGLRLRATGAATGAGAARRSCPECEHVNAQIQQLSGDALNELLAHKERHFSTVTKLIKQINCDLKVARDVPGIETITVDTHEPVRLPKMTSRVHHYMRKLNVYGVAVHAVHGALERTTHMAWLEHTAGRGVHELASCLRRYIVLHVRDPAVYQLIVWMGACGGGGQARSLKLLLMLLHALGSHPTLQTIVVRYPAGAHCSLPHEPHLAGVERALHDAPAYHTLEEVVGAARALQPLELLGAGDVLCADVLHEYVVHGKMSAEFRARPWETACEVTLCRDRPLALLLRHDLDGPVTELRLGPVPPSTAASAASAASTASSHELRPLHELALPLLWPDGRRLLRDKVKDLRDLTRIMPAHAKPFYAFLDHVKLIDGEEDIDGFDISDVRD